MPKEIWKKGKKKYCKRGHERTPENVNKSGGCIRCTKFIRNTPDKKEKAKQYAKEYYLENPEVFSVNGKEYYKNNKEAVCLRNEKRRLSKQGWTPETVAEAREKQNNKCAVCGVDFSLTRANADHIHTILPIPRALVCNSCNRALGFFKDSPELCEKGADYLRKYGYTGKDSGS